MAFVPDVVENPGSNKFYSVRMLVRKRLVRMFRLTAKKEGIGVQRVRGRPVITPESPRVGSS